MEPAEHKVPAVRPERVHPLVRTDPSALAVMQERLLGLVAAEEAAVTTVVVAAEVAPVQALDQAVARVQVLFLLVGRAMRARQRLQEIQVIQITAPV